MELLHSRTGACDRREFEKGLLLLKGKTAWTRGIWTFAPTDQRTWSAIQNTPKDIDVLANYLVREAKRALRHGTSLNTTTTMEG